MYKDVILIVGDIMDEYINCLKEKFNYSQELSDLLGKIVPTMIQYYGDEYADTIKDALSNCEIHIQKENEDTTAYLQQYFDTKKEWDIPMMAGAFIETNVSKKDEDVELKNLIYIKTNFGSKYDPFDYENGDKVKKLVHEMCHLVKTYDRYKKNGDDVVAYSGFIEENFSYDPVKNEYVSTKSTNVGIEEAFNSFDETQIMYMLTGVKYKATYPGLASAASQIMRYPNAASAIRKSQFTGSDDWIKALGGQEQAMNVANSLEDWVQLFYMPHSELKKPDHKEYHDLVVNKAVMAVNSCVDRLEKERQADAIIAGMEAGTISDNPIQEENTFSPSLRAFTVFKFLSLFTIVLFISVAFIFLYFYTK